jgi:hypothetical protein
MKIQSARALIVAVVLICATLIQGGAVADAAQAEMGFAHAGRYYLRHVCTSNAAGDRFDKKIWRGRRTIGFPEIRRRLPQIRHESRLFGRAQHRFASALFNPPGPWPATVARSVKTMANKTVRDAAILLKMGSASSAHRWGVLTGRHNTTYSSSTSTSERIRAKLGLPAAGHGC